VLGSCKLAPWDYYGYHLYDDERHTAASKREFIGDNRCRQITVQVSDKTWWGVLEDKLLAAAVLKAHGVPNPQITAVYHPVRNYAAPAVLRSAEELIEHFRRRMSYPCFGKLVTGLKSNGASLVEAYDESSDCLCLAGRRQVGVTDFAKRVVDYCSTRGAEAFDPSAGYLFQEVVRQHPAIRERCGERLGTVRLYVGVDNSGPIIFAATWKIAAPQNIADNFWRPGNLLAALDVQTGEVQRVTRGLGIELEVLEESPYTGQRLVGFRLPYFDELRRLVLHGAMLFPKIRLQGWDVAIGPDGPVVVEINNGSSFWLCQMASGRGLLTPEFREFLREASALNQHARRSGSRFQNTPILWRLKGVGRFLAGLFR